MTEDKNQEYNSENITFTLSRNPECIMEYQVKTNAELVKKARTQAIRAIAKEVSLPGFRKGKAPDSLIVKKYPKPLEEQWQKAIADLAFRECQQQVPTPLLEKDTRISFNIEKKSLEEGAEMTFSFETEPEVPDIDFSKLELEEVKKEAVDQKKIDATLLQIQTFFADWEPVSGRGAREKDYVVLDVDIIEEDPPKKALTNARFEVSPEKMAKWMFDLVQGLKVGEAREGVSEADPDAPEEEKAANPPKKVRVSLRNIELPKLHPIDDELAKKVGVKTVQEMKENLEKLLIKQADEHVQKAYRDQINEYLLNTYTFDLPKSLLQKETQFRIKQLVTDPSFQRKLMSMNDEERKSAIADLEKQGERAVRLFYIARKVIQDEKIQISPTEVHHEVKTPLEAMFSEQSDVYDSKEQSQEQKAIAMSRLILTKAEDFLISKAQIVVPKPKKKTAISKKETKAAAKEDKPAAKKAAPQKEPSAKKKAAPKKKTTGAKKAAPKKKKSDS